RLLAPAQLRAVLSEQRYLAVHDPGTSNLARLAGMVRPLAPEPTPCTCTYHSISYGNLLPQFINACVGNLQPYDALFCSSSDSRQAVQRLLEHLCLLTNQQQGAWRHRLEPVPLGIDAVAFAPTLPAGVARRLLALPEAGRYVLYLGRLSPFDKADLDVLLRAFAVLARSPGGEDLHLLLAGDDSQRYSNFLHSRAQGLGVATVTHLLPNLSGVTQRLALWAADLFVSPADSVQESFGLTVLEAMAAGLPVIASDWAGYRDLVTDGDSGYLVPTIWGQCTSTVEAQTELGGFMGDHLLLGQSVVVNEDALIDRLRRLLEQPQQRKAMGERARVRAAAYDWPLIVQRYEATWRNLKQEALAAHSPPSPSRFPFWQVFGPYASQQLEPTDLVEIRRGAAPPPPLPAPLQLLLPGDTLERLMRGMSGGAQPVSALVSSETDMLALLWLAKAGLVRIRLR
ncbi:MAG TPA: glycosyltransferase family 4 protein, partial [Chloroflexota bacterium]|nr:glycosyltransferase family 4 protein [Chloroflexota bacterium]